MTRLIAQIWSDTELFAPVAVTAIPEGTSADTVRDEACRLGLDFWASEGPAVRALALDDSACSYFPTVTWEELKAGKVSKLLSEMKDWWNHV